MKKEKESIRKRITAFWKEKDQEGKKAFLSFMEKMSCRNQRCTTICEVSV